MSSRRFRVEHVCNGTTVVLGFLSIGHAHHSTLEPYVSRILSQGGSGSLALIDDETGEEVASRRVQSFEPGRVKRFGGDTNRGGDR